MVSVMDFGEVALAGGFLRDSTLNAEQRYPLELFFCEDCYAVQLVDVVDPDVLFRDYFYFSSAIATLREHFVDYSTEVTSRFLDPQNSTVVEIGCNDGILLRPFAEQGVRTVVGVDPATNVVNTINDPRLNIVNGFFDESLAEEIEVRFGPADMIVANNVYAHIPDILGVTRGVRRLLGENGVFIFEVHHLGKLINGYQYDMVYHEHLYYYSLIALENHFARHDMEVFDVKAIPIHGGSMRFYVRHRSAAHAAPSPRVAMLRKS